MSQRLHLEAIAVNPPSISVIIPCFNLGQYLDEAVESVLAQTRQDFEILIVDDGSTDPETQHLLASYARPKTRVWRTANRGLAAARNFLIERATGTFLCALDADDRLHPRYFERALDAFASDPGLTFVSSWVQMFGEEDGVWRRDRCDLPALLAEDTVMTAAVVRRDAVAALGGYDEGMPHQGDEDWDLWIRLARAGCRGTILPETLFFYRRRAGSMSTRCTSGQVHLDLVRYLVRKHADAYREHLREVLLAQDRRIAALLRATDALERERDGQLKATRAALEAELDRLSGRLAEASRRRQELSALQEECERLRGEVAALRGSLTWRLTAPARAACDLIAAPFRRSRP
jgi:glycosyltransferase involved in cell wall biosynthesis